ncbi:MAG: lysine--tRNA ligase [Candidatus Omnitrophica bacterium]|jgi:lysyl-tRNA synthetase class 2|nr:lysine--tRNA ligase [Candidatus Omnitrophota bacterium]
MELEEIIQQRKDKLTAWEATGKAYQSAPGDREEIGPLLKDFPEGKKVVFAGRLTAKRLHGKVVFADLRDSSGKIQLYVKSDFVGKDNFSAFDSLDIADFISASGELFKTHTGEPTLKLEAFTLLAKALRPLPEKWHGLKDTETRYRQRYLDLVSNEEVKKVFLARSQIVKAIRDFLDTKGFVEVETPMMHSIPGGAAGRPFKTFHNEYSMQLFMRIAPELYLKRLLVGGMDKVYEINRSFRNEGISTRHNPEFTMLEVYQSYSSCQGMMRLVEELVVSLAEKTLGGLKLNYDGKEIDLSLPWKVVSFAQVVKEKFGILPEDTAEKMLQKLHAHNLSKESTKLTRSQIAKVIEEVLEKDMSFNPVFVTDYFTHLSPLAQSKTDNPNICERFELYIAGMEVGNAYSELNDPIEQKRRFEEEIKEQEAAENKSVDEDYCLALEHGMPPAGGLGVGIDRLVMLLTGQTSIRDVILFPLLKKREVG